VTGGVGGTGEGCVKVEDSVYIKEEVSIEVEDAVDIKEEVSIEIEDPVYIKEEVGIKFEAVYVKDEVQECTSVPPVQTEQEVRLWGVCEVVAAHGFMPFIYPTMETVELTLSPLLFKALLHGQKDHVFFSGHLIYILKQGRFRAFRPARDI
jgi:hypothetical protein